MPDWFDENDPAKQDWFAANAPTDTLPEVVATQPEGGDGFLAKVNAALRKPSPAWLQAPEQATRELVGGMVPHDIPSYLESIYPPAAAARLGANLAQGDVSGLPLVGRVPEIAAADETPAFSKERYLTAMKTLMDVGMLAGGGERAPLPLRGEPLATPDLPPSPNLGPGTIAGDVSRALERRFTLQDTPPEPPLAPPPPIEDTLANIPKEPPVFNPELGPQTIPETRMQLATEPAVDIAALQKRKAAIEASIAPSRAIGQKTVHDAELADIEQQLKGVEERVQPGQFAKPGYTAVDTPPEATTPTAQPEFIFGEPAYHGDTQYTLHKRGNNVEVGQINASSAGGGIKFLQDLTRWADENGLTLSGDARPMRPREGVRGLPQDKLKRLYRHFGFEEYGDYDRMMRVPREKPPEAPVQAPETAAVAPEAPWGVPVADIPTEDVKYAGGEPVPQAFSEEPHVSAIANRFTAERAAAGELGEIAPGESVNTMDLVHHGLKMSPEQVNASVSRVMQGGDIPINDVAALRGEEARLSQRSGDLSRAARANPSPEAQLAADNAFKDLTDFHNGPVAQAKRNWHHQGKLMQGEIPVDLSTLNGMREAWLKDTGKPPPAHVEPKLQRVADNLARAIDEERAAARNGGEAIEKATQGRKMPTPEEVRNSIAERMGVEPCII